MKMLREVECFFGECPEMTATAQNNTCPVQEGKLESMLFKYVEDFMANCLKASKTVQDFCAHLKAYEQTRFLDTDA